MDEIFELIRLERKRQDDKWNNNSSNHHPLERNSILLEEIGEVAKEVNQYTFDNKSPDDMKKELVQVAAVVVAWLENVKIWQEEHQ